MSFIDHHALGVGIFMTAAAHPLSYCKVLIQLGHEPLSPVFRRNVFFRKQLQYPNILQYMKHIKTTDGSLGLYRGLLPRIGANVSTSITYMAVDRYLSLKFPREGAPPAEIDDPSYAIRKVTNETCREMTAKCCAIIVSHPFHVIALRSMAQFVGHETYYSCMLSAVKEIYNEEGILGFFAGIIPRIAAEVAQIWICNLLAHLLNTYLLNEQHEMKEMRQYSQALTNYFAHMVTYPLSLASTVVVVSSSRLAAGTPPHMPKYDGWWSCLGDLRKKGLSNRGSSVLFRPVLRCPRQTPAIVEMPPPPIPK